MNEEVEVLTLSAQNPVQTRPLAAIYIRVSTEEQAKQGFSLAGQEEALKNYCAAMGYEIYKVYRDGGKSAKDMVHRPAMQELLQDVEKRKVSAIMIYKLDRFSRSLKDLILTIEKLKVWGVDFLSLQDRIDTTSASGKLMFHIISAFAEFERNIIGERTTFGMKKKSKDGGAVSKPPFGYKMVDKKLVIDAEKSARLKELFQEFLTTEESLNQLSQKYGLSVNGLKKVLRNRAYLGEVKFAGESTVGVHSPLLDTSLFKEVQEKLKRFK